MKPDPERTAALRKLAARQLRKHVGSRKQITALKKLARPK